MNEPITFTLSSLLLLAGAIVTFEQAVNAVAVAIHHFREPEETQDERIGNLERKSVKDWERMNRMDERLDKIEEGNAITQRALLALLAHGIDGNDIEAMKQAKAELTNYLIGR